jgi:hypothetical protein
VIRIFDERRNLFISDKHTLSSGKMLYKDCDRKGSVAKKKYLVMNLKGLGTKTNSLTIKKQVIK